jgi:hypothetical protein
VQCILILRIASEIERGQGLGIELPGDIESLADLIAPDGGRGFRTRLPIDGPVIKAFVLEGLLDGLGLVIGASEGGDQEDRQQQD